ncbi:MAG TPA: HIT family protein [Thermoanaerobaculia bacterium]|nr:HIT family protein [Thermoanaerobaculia bacterium]
MNECVFCTDVARAGDVVFEDEQAWVVLHEDWSPRGHAMIAAKRHVENASDLDADEWAHLTALWHRVERVLLRETGAERAIIMKLGIATPHLHVHVYPMRASDSRADVFEAIEGKRREARDERFVVAVRERLSLTSPPR